jgi:hypothetical protein
VNQAADPALRRVGCQGGMEARCHRKKEDSGNRPLAIVID